MPDDYFVVSGFDVHGKLLNAGHSQSSNAIAIALYAEKTSKFEQCENIPTDLLDIPLNNHKNYKQNISCYTLINVNGAYKFTNIPPGNYLLKPYVTNKDIQLHIKPTMVEFNVGRDFVNVADHFEVTGFNVFGKVLAAANGKGISNAEIKLNGQSSSTKTDSNGNYVLRNIKADTYTIQVIADSVQINDQTIRISLGQPQLPDILVSEFKVCGQVISQQSYTIAITRHASTFHTQATSKPGTGIWCVYLASGRYIAKVLTSTEDRTMGVQ